MSSSRQESHDLAFHPVTPDRWHDLVRLFEHHGNPGYCWCMRWRLKSTQYNQLDSKGRRHALQALVGTGIPIGILAYLDGVPAGWCSIAPRETYTLLERSTTLKRIDELPVWSVVCFFVDRKVRGQGLSVKLLQAAVAHAFSQGATIVEGYPVEPDRSYRFMGSPAIFERAGFQEVGMTERGRRIMRFVKDQGT